MEKERRVTTAPIELRAVDTEPPVIRGYGAVFNSVSENLGGFVEMIQPGAFAAALTRSDVRALFNHDPNLILGRTTSGTLRVFEDEQGLVYEIDPPNTQAARDLQESLRRGDVSQSSFGFTVRADKWLPASDEREYPLRIITEIDELYDVSPVTYPAYPATSAAVRQMAVDVSRAAHELAQTAGSGRTRRMWRQLQILKRR